MEAMTKDQDLTGKVARLWCLPQHGKKEMDTDFAESIIALVKSETSDKDQEILALRAQNEGLRVALKKWGSEDANYEVNEALSKSPAQHLADLKAEVSAEAFEEAAIYLEHKANMATGAQAEEADMFRSASYWLREKSKRTT